MRVSLGGWGWGPSKIPAAGVHTCPLPQFLHTVSPARAPSGQTPHVVAQDCMVTPHGGEEAAYDPAPEGLFPRIESPYSSRVGISFPLLTEVESRDL